MLHILLLVLKIIGILLAVILGILVLLILTVLFVPVRYEALGKCGGKLDTLKGKVKVTWLLHLVRADVYYREKKLKWRLRIAWKKILGGESWENGGGEERDITERRKENEQEKEPDEIFIEEPEPEQRSEPDQGSEPDQKAEPGQKHEADQKSEDSAGDSVEIPEFLGEPEPADEEPDAQPEEAAHNERAESGEKTESRFEKIKYTIRAFCDKIKELAEKKNRVMDFIRDEAHIGAFRRVKAGVFRLLRKLKPRRFILRAQFGTGDPYLTGQILAGLAVLYPFLGDDLAVKPDFEERSLKGTLDTKGHIRFWSFFALAVRLLLCRDVRRTYRDIRNFEL